MLRYLKEDDTWYKSSTAEKSLLSDDIPPSTDREGIEISKQKSFNCSSKELSTFEDTQRKDAEQSIWNTFSDKLTFELR